MATLEHLWTGGRLIKFTADLEPGTMPVRVIYMAAEFDDWVEEVLYDQRPDDDDRTIEPYEQVESIFDDFVIGRPMVYGVHKKLLRPETKGVWSLRTPDVRVFGWFSATLCHWTNQKASEERGPMKTRSFRIDKRRRSYLRLISEIKHALAQALTEEHAERGLTMAEMARTLEVDRSHISRKLSGETNMTLETLADLAYALDRPVKVSLPSRHCGHASNYAQTASGGNMLTKSLQHQQTSATASAKIKPDPARGSGVFMQVY